jgi:hypothetical protein
MSDALNAAPPRGFHAGSSWRRVVDTFVSLGSHAAAAVVAVL